MLFVTVVASRGKHFVMQNQWANVLLKFCARACIAISLGAALTEPFAWRFPVGTRGPN